MLPDKDVQQPLLEKAPVWASEDVECAPELERTPRRSPIKELCFFVLGFIITLQIINYVYPFMNIQPQHHCSKSLAGRRLIQLSPTHQEWIDEDALEYLLSLRHVKNDATLNATVASRRGKLLKGISDLAIDQLSQRDGYRVGYIDVTPETMEETNMADPAVEIAVFDMPDYPSPNKTAHPEIAKLFDQVSADELRYIVTNLSTNWKTRYYKSSHASDVSFWIQKWFDSQSLPNTTTSLDENSFFKQPNVIARLESPSSSNETIIMGGHLDSTSQLPWFNAPGADDDGSGTAVVMHVFSILAASNITLKYPLEAHLYAGEEGGLYGSQSLAKKYKQAGRKVRGMLNVEMVGWQGKVKDGKQTTVTVLSDPQEEMGEYMGGILDEYVKKGVNARETECGYGCSDHYSWSNLGYPVVCISSYGPRDPELNPYYHSIGDTVDKLDFDKMTEFAKAALAWVIEVGS